MDVTELRSEYLKHGGLETEIQGIEDQEVLELMLSSQKEIHKYLEEEKQDDEGDKTDLEKLEDLRQIPVPQDVHSDSYREHVNKIYSQENEVRKRLGMTPKKLNILDKDLLDLLQLDSYNVSHTCKEFLQNFEEDKAQQQDLKDRLQTLSNGIAKAKEDQEKYFEFLDYATSTLERCKKIPERWVFNDKKAQIEPNPVFQNWKKEVLELKHKLDAKKKLADSLEKHLGQKKDQRTSIFRLSERVDQIVSDNSLEEVSR